MVHFRKKGQKRGGPREVWQKIILFRNFFRNPSLFLRSLPNVFTHPPQGFVRFGTTKGEIQVGKGDFQGDLGRFWGVWKSATQPTHIWEKPPPEQRFFLRLPFNIQLPSCSCMVQLKDNKSMQFGRWFFENSSWISLSQILTQKVYLKFWVKRIQISTVCLPLFGNRMPLCRRIEGMGFLISFTCKIICICKSAKISAP